jgi:hypothetical protein
MADIAEAPYQTSAPHKTLIGQFLMTFVIVSSIPCLDDHQRTLAMKKLDRHIRRLIVLLGYPVEMMASPSLTRQALKQNGISATENQVRLAIARSYIAIYEEKTGSQIISGKQFQEAFANGF